MDDEIFYARVKLCAEIEECTVSAGHCATIGVVLMVAAMFFMLLSLWAIGGTLMALGAIAGGTSFVLLARKNYLHRRLDRYRNA